MARESGCFEYGATLVGVGCGCSGVLTGGILMPASVTVRAVEIAAPFLHDISPKVFPKTEISLPDKMRMVVSGRNFDAVRAVLATAVLAIIETPLALPHVFPPLAAFSEKIPLVVPEVAAAAAVVYTLSYFHLKANEEALRRDLIAEEVSKTAN